MIKLKPTSWKIMLEILVKANPTKVVEVPIQFDERQAGESKFSAKQAMLYFKHLAKLFQFKHQHIIKFGLIGLSGMGIHFPLLYVLTDIVGLWYIWAAIIAIVVASTSNYILNHKFTFKDRAVKNHVIGWAKYQVLSAITDSMHIGLLAFFVEVIGLWYILGTAIAIVTIFPVKFGIASTFIWQRERNPANAAYDWESFYKGHTLQKHWKRSIAKTVWDWIPSSNNLLNVGCGSSPIIAKYPNSTNVDINEAKLLFLKEKLPSISITCAGAENLPFDNEQFEDIICIEMIEHLEDAEKAIAEIARVLKPNRNVVIATPDYSKLFWRISKEFIGVEEDHVTHFTKETLESLCRKYGLISLRHKYIASCDLCEMFTKVASVSE